MIELFEDKINKNPNGKLKMDYYSKPNKIKSIVSIFDLDPKHYKVLNKGEK